jgi:hypothetical protein
VNRNNLGLAAAAVLGSVLTLGVNAIVPPPTTIIVPDGVVCVTMTPSPTATATATATNTPRPTATTTRVAPTPTKVPTYTPSPVEVTPIAPTPEPPYTEKAEINYIPKYNLIIRTSPEQGTNATTGRVYAGQKYMVYHIRTNVDKSQWGCMDDVHPSMCKRWFAIVIDLNKNGVITADEIHAVPEPGPTDQ